VKEGITEVKNEFHTKFLYWKNLKSIKAKVALIFLALGIIGLKIYTTVFTFDWLADLVKTI